MSKPQFRHRVEVTDYQIKVTAIIKNPPPGKWIQDMEARHEIKALTPWAVVITLIEALREEAERLATEKYMQAIEPTTEAKP